MAFKIFLDANFVLDLTLKRAAFSEAEKIMQLSILSELELYTTPAILHITGYFLKKAYGSAVTKKIVLSLLDEIQIIECDHATAKIALSSQITDIEDALQYYTALASGMSFFISSDKALKKFSMPQLPVVTAKELLKLLKSNLKVSIIRKFS